MERKRFVPQDVDQFTKHFSEVGILHMYVYVLWMHLYDGILCVYHRKTIHVYSLEQADSQAS